MDAMGRIKHALLIFFAVYPLLSSSTLAKSVKYCDKKQNYAVKVRGVEITPEPVVSGKPATFKILGSTGETISGGTLVIEVSYYGIRVHTEEYGICTKLNCPVDAGNFVLSHSQTLPAITPPGSYTLKMTMKDENDQQLTCISFRFTIRFGSSVSDS